MPELAVAILTISDRSFRGEMVDLSGPALAQFALERLWKVVDTSLVDDDISNIESAVRELLKRPDVNLILTTGGTGIGPRDNTPDVLDKLFDKKLPGIGEMMRLEGLKSTSTSILSRSCAGVIGTKLIISLPGSPRGAFESVSAIADVIPHALEMINNLTSHQPT